MLTTVQGVFRNGKVELQETPPGLKEARVIVTFLPPEGPIDLRAEASVKKKPPKSDGVLVRPPRIGIVLRWKFTMTFKRGDVVLALFPDSNLRTAKPRPVLVVQRDNLGSGLAQTVVAMISSNMVRAGHPSRVAVSLSSPAGKRTGLQSDSVIIDNLRTILDTHIDRAFGVWLDMAAVDAALRHTLNL